MRFLPVLGLGHDLVPNLPEHHSDLRVLLRQAIDEGAGKRAVPAITIKRYITGLRGIDDQRALLGRGYGEAAFAHVVRGRHDNARRGRLLIELRRFGKWVVAA